MEVQEALPVAQPALSPRRWQALGSILIGIGVAWFLAYIIPLLIPRFFDPTVEPVRTIHGAFGIIAIATAVVQILPGLRKRFPLVHRWNGRIYVFLGVLPSAIILIPVIFVMGDPTLSILMFWNALWIVTTVLAWRAVRRRQYLVHRRWMTYSIAITLTAATNGALAILSPYLTWLVPTPVLLDVIHWLTFLVHLSVAHWIVTHYTATPYPARRRAVATTPVPSTPTILTPEAATAE